MAVNAAGQAIQLLLSGTPASGLLENLRPGDLLRGRIVDLLPGQKAVVNIRGFNLVADLKGLSASLQKGDILQVAVKQIDAPGPQPGQVPSTQGSSATPASAAAPASSPEGQASVTLQLVRVLPAPAQAAVAPAQPASVAPAAAPAVLENLLELAHVPVTSLNLQVAGSLRAHGLPVTAASLQKVFSQAEFLQSPAASAAPGQASSFVPAEVPGRALIQSTVSLLTFLDQQNPTVQRHLEIQQAVRTLNRLPSEASLPISLRQSLEAVQLDAQAGLTRLTAVLRTLPPMETQVALQQVIEPAPPRPLRLPALISRELFNRAQASAGTVVTTQSLSEVAVQMLTELQDPASWLVREFNGTGLPVKEAGSPSPLPLPSVMTGLSAEIPSPQAPTQPAHASDTVSIPKPVSGPAPLAMVPSAPRSSVVLPAAPVPMGFSSPVVNSTPMETTPPVETSALPKTPAPAVTPAQAPPPPRDSAGSAAPQAALPKAPESPLQQMRQSLEEVVASLRTEPLPQPPAGPAALRQVFVERGWMPQPEISLPALPKEAVLQAVVFLQARGLPVTPAFAAPVANTFALSVPQEVSGRELVTGLSQIKTLAEALTPEVLTARPAVAEAVSTLGKAYEAMALDPARPDLAAQLRGLVEDGGIQFEARLAAESQAPAARPLKAGDSPVQPHGADLKAELLKARDSVEQALRHPAPLSEGARESVQAVAGQLRDTLASLTTLQLANLPTPSQESAVMHIPLWLGREIMPGQLSLYWKHGKEGRPDDKEPVSMVFQLHTGALGEVKVFLQLWQKDCNCRVEVASEEARAHFAGYMDLLKEGFSANTPFELNSLDLSVGGGSSSRPPFLPETPAQADQGFNVSA